MSTDTIINVNGDSLQALDITLLLVVITLLPTLVEYTYFGSYVQMGSFGSSAGYCAVSPYKCIQRVF